MKLPPLLALLSALTAASTSTQIPLASASVPSSPWPTHSFRTTNATAPILNTTKFGQTAPGYIFIAPSTQTSGSPAIYTDEGDLVWLGPEGKTYAYQPQMLNGEPVLTFWEGHNVKGFGYGHIIILDSSYQEIHRVTLPGTHDERFVTATNESFPSYIDIHESAITEEETILVTAVNVTQTDLTPVGGKKDGWVQDGLVYEIDIATNEILFSWSAVEHQKQLSLNYVEFPLGEKGANKSAPYEYPHLNSVSKYGDQYLVSSRYMCSIFLLDRDGEIVWLFHGQKGDSYILPNNSTSKFCYQHDARIHSHTNPGKLNESIILSLHNNDNAENTGLPHLTTNLIFNLHPATRSATLLSRTFDRQDPISAISQGNYQSISSNETAIGHWFVGQGAIPKVEEFDQHEKLVMRGWFGGKIENATTYDWSSYRAFRAPWTGRPKGGPDVVACKSDNGQGLDVYVSWNGATDVKGWRVLGVEGQGMRSLKDMSKKAGFETKIAISLDPDQSFDAIMVEAIGGGSDGVRSKAVTVGSS
ncbi:ASST-domain-containing protein [Aspergillus venezuelensis]